MDKDAVLRVLVEEAKAGNEGAINTLRDFLRRCAESFEPAHIVSLTETVQGIRKDALRRYLESN